MSTVSYERMPTSFTSGFGLKDFSFSLNQSCTSSAWNAIVESRPEEFLEGAFSWGKTITTTEDNPKGYSSLLDWNTQTLTAQLKIHFNVQSSFWIGWERKEGNGKVLFKKDALIFGDLAKGTLIFDQWQAGGQTIAFSLPISCEYNYRRWEGNNAGHIESWPFTPLASTVFDNRLYYTIGGSVDAHQLESSTLFGWGWWQIKPALGILYVLSDISLKHWESDFLVFGAKNSKVEPFLIQRWWLLRLGCQLDFPLFGLEAALQMEQYIPISIEKREERTSPSVPSTPAGSGSSGGSTTTDGGRRIRLQIFIP